MLPLPGAICSFTIIEIADRVSGAAPVDNTAGFAATTAKASANSEALAQELLAMADDDPRKHKVRWPACRQRLRKHQTARVCWNRHRFLRCSASCHPERVSQPTNHTMARPATPSQALGMYRVQPEETTWDAVCATAACDAGLAAALNGGKPPVPGISVIVPTLG